MTGVLQRRPDLLPSLAVGLASLLWGLFWLPMRTLGDLGLEGGWPGLAVFALSTAFLLPGALIRRRLPGLGLGLAVTGLMTGAAFALYATSLLLTEVVRVLLLFYLTPVWSTLLGCLLLGERVSRARAAALVLGIAGLMVVLGVDQGFPMPRGLGDWLALLSGLAWAYGSLRLFREDTTPLYEHGFAFMAGAGLVSALVVCLPLAGVGAVPGVTVVQAVTPPLALFVVLLFLPVVFITLSGVRKLSPGRVGLLLMGEAVVGIASAALLTDEPFGLREMIGTLLVLSAAGVEVIQPPRPLPARERSTG
ncbi:MAG: DMT family transporter [Planctomycetota bacterium]